MPIAPIAPGFPSRVTSMYGPRPRGPNRSEFHAGLDIAAAAGTSVLAILPGRVITYLTGQMDGYGNTVVIDNGPGRAGRYQLYAHLATIEAIAGATVAAGTWIGTVGQTAGTRVDPARKVSGAHLHLEFLTAWPPVGRKLDRLDPAAELGALGIVARFGEPLTATAAAAPDAERPALPAAPAAIPIGAAAAGAGALVFLLLAALGLSKVKEQRPRHYSRALLATYT